MKELAEAQQILVSLAPPQRLEWLPRQSALGRVLARAVTARVDVPALDVSAMDGYTFGHEIRAGEPIAVVGTIAAGDAPGFVLRSGCAARIMTGAPIPIGGDRVIPVEQTDRGLEVVRPDRTIEPGSHVRRRGEVVRSGEPLLEAGQLLAPATLAWLASHGIAEVEVIAPPTVAIATTGDEVVAPEHEPQPGQLRDSHTDFLSSSLSRLGITPHRLGILPDRREALEAAVRTGLESDVLVLCGGVSAGAFDLVEPVLLDAGCEISIDAVAIQPGKPLVIARGPSGQVVFGLPGNPASVVVTYSLFVRPLIERALGHPPSSGRRARLTTATPASAPTRARVVPVRLDEAGAATPVSSRGSHDLGAFARADGLLLVPAGQQFEAGATIDVLEW